MKIVRSLFTAITSAALAATALAQGPQGPQEVAAAGALLRAGKPDSAIIVLEAFFQRNPNAQQGHLLLGDAYKQKGDTSKALSIYSAPSLPRALRVQGLVRTAQVHAAQQRPDSAFALLARVKATGTFDMDALNDMKEFAGLKGDPRFATLMFRPEDFKNPFVEPVRIIHEWAGETKNDQYSWIARGIGDVDGDKVSDIVTSAPTYGANGQLVGPGKVYVLSGKTGKTLWTKVGEGRGNLGTGLEGAGDVNRDGVPDVVAGAPFSNRAFVFSGKDGAVLHAFTGTQQGETFGNAVSSAGDQNGDGFADVVIGAPGNNAVGQGAGRVYVYSGKDGSLLYSVDGQRAGDAFGSIVAGQKRGLRSPILVGAPGAGPRQRGQVLVYTNGAKSPTHVIDSDSTGGALGAMFTSVVGDVNGDKVADYYAADFANAASGPATGRIYLHSGKDGKRLRVLTGERPGDGFGIGSADVGDVNKDGYDDLLVGAWQHSSAAASGGKVYLYSGKDGALLRSITGRVPGETFGFDATGVGDLDGDGVIDFLVTSSWSNVNGYRSGRMYVISGK